MTSINVKRHDGYIKSLLTTEMLEVVTELNDIIDCKNKDGNYRKIDDASQNLIKKCLEEIQSEENVQTNFEYDNLIRDQDITKLLRLILENDLDFVNRLNGKRDIFSLWQKTRACKNEEFSIKFRENGNDYLRKGELNKALCLYNEALLFGKFCIIKVCDDWRYDPNIS